MLVANTCRAVRHAKPNLVISHGVLKAEEVRGDPEATLEKVSAPSNGELELKVTSCGFSTKG